jgi:Uma2 family endonuclease
MTISERYQETITLPRAVRFPIELLPPEGFDAERPETWPSLDGRLEFVDGRLLYMPPCGDLQQDTVTDVVITLGGWVRAHPDFVLGTNEAGMRLSGMTRAADAAIWARSALGDYSGGLRRAPPLLAVEVAGEEENEALLLEKARWYVSAGVATVWLVLPASHEVLEVTDKGQRRFAGKDRLPHPAGLDGLEPPVAELFTQISARGR